MHRLTFLLPFLQPSVNFLHAPVKQRAFFRALFQFPAQRIVVVDRLIRLITNLMLQARPKIHCDGADLYLNGDGHAAA